MKNLSAVTQKFVLHWGEMGTRWGINRTVAQIHALLFLSDRPLDAEEICETLGVARSNVSNSLKELQNWRIVKVVHLAGDRRDHFESIKDVYEMFRVIIAERKRREIDPTVVTLKNCVSEAKEEGLGKYGQQRLKDLLDFFQTATDFYEQVNRLPTKAAVKAVKMGGKFLKTFS